MILQHFQIELVINSGNLGCMVPSLGSVRGSYKGEPNLGFDRMEEVQKLTGLLLILHGGTGIPLKNIQWAVFIGSARINVNTENQIV